MRGFYTVLLCGIVSCAIAMNFNVTTPEELFTHYSDIFPHGNRNSASHRWATVVLSNAGSLTEEQIKALFAGFCPVSGSPIASQRRDDSRWHMQLKNLDGDALDGFVHFCCWPCACDTHDFLRVDPTPVETAEGSRTFNFLVMGDPCVQSAKIPQEAPDVTCGEDGALEMATLSQTGFVIVGLLEDYDASKPAKEVQSTLETKCANREMDGFHSGMGTIFRDIAELHPFPKADSSPFLSAVHSCVAGSALSEYQALVNAANSNPVVLAGAVYRGSDHYRCFVEAEEKFTQAGVCFLKVDISDELWSYLKCLYPNERTANGMMMHSYVFIGGRMVGNGFIVDPSLDTRFTWGQLESAMRVAGASFQCAQDCDALIGEAEKQRLEEVVATQPVVMYGWEPCPCVGTARARFMSKHVCFIENTWTNQNDPKMKYLQCKYGREHHSFIWFNEKRADGSMAGGKFLGNGFNLGPTKMSDSRFTDLIKKSGARTDCQGLEDRNLIGKELESCTDQTDRTTTGFTRSGSCVWESSDRGYHQVCVKMSNKFIRQSATIDRNDLSSVVSEGGHWCICAWAWASAVKRDPVNYEGIKLECGRTNERLRKVYETYINNGDDICSPGGVCYKAKAALEAVNKLCPENGAPQAQLQKAQAKPDLSGLSSVAGGSQQPEANLSSQKLYAGFIVAGVLVTFLCVNLLASHWRRERKSVEAVPLDSGYEHMYFKAA